MFERPSEVTDENPKEELPRFEAVADALSKEEQAEFALLSEQVSDVAESHGGRIDDAKLTSAERELVDRYTELKSRAFGNIRMAE